MQRTSTFPRPDELYDCYRLVYLEQDQQATPEQLAGAASFKVILTTKSRVSSLTPYLK